MKLSFAGMSGLKQAAIRVRSVPEASARAAYRAVNQVGASAMTAARRSIAAEVNLPASYIGQQMRLAKATAANPVAEIRARMRHVRLARFAARQLTVRSKHPERSRGDSSRGIAWGRKAAGVSVKVKRSGSRKKMPGAFLLPLRAGKTDGGNGMGVFLRVGRGRDDIDHRYGPSPYQLFRTWRDKNVDAIQAQLADAYASQLSYELTGKRR